MQCSSNNRLPCGVTSPSLQLLKVETMFNTRDSGRWSVFSISLLAASCVFSTVSCTQEAPFDNNADRTGDFEDDHQADSMKDQTSAQNAEVDPEAEVLTRESQFAELTTNQKIDKLGRTLRDLWGDNGQYFVPENAQNLPSDPTPLQLTPDTFILTLRWQEIERKIRPDLQAAFQLDSNARCVFKAPGRFLVTNPLYELIIKRAAGMDGSEVRVTKRVDAQITDSAPGIRKDLLKSDGTGKPEFSAISASLMPLQLPGGLTFDQEWSTDSSGLSMAELATHWSQLPDTIQGKRPEDAFLWRMFITVREAVSIVETEDVNIQTNANRVEVISGIQFAADAEEPFDRIDNISVSAIGFDLNLVVMKSRSRWQSELTSAMPVLASPASYRHSGQFPTPATFVGASEEMMQLVRDIHGVITRNLTK